MSGCKCTACSDWEACSEQERNTFQEHQGALQREAEIERQREVIDYLRKELATYGDQKSRDIIASQKLLIDSHGKHIAKLKQEQEVTGTALTAALVAHQKTKITLSDTATQLAEAQKLLIQGRSHRIEAEKQIRALQDEALPYASKNAELETQLRDTRAKAQALDQERLEAHMRLTQQVSDLQRASAIQGDSYKVMKVKVEGYAATAADQKKQIEQLQQQLTEKAVAEPASDLAIRIDHLTRTSSKIQSRCDAMARLADERADLVARLGRERDAAMNDKLTLMADVALEKKAVKRLEDALATVTEKHKNLLDMHRRDSNEAGEKIRELAELREERKRENPLTPLLERIKALENWKDNK